MAQSLTDTEPQTRLIRLGNLWWVTGALAAMAAVIIAGDLWVLNFVHVIAGLLWTGIDLFMGFVLGPVLRQLDLASRRAIVIRLMPRMLFLMPTLAVVTGTAGYVLAERMGFLALDYPAAAWVVASLILIALLTVQGLFFLLPTNLLMCWELQKAQPDLARIARLTRRYLQVTALQGLMQVTIILIMARFVTGL